VDSFDDDPELLETGRPRSVGGPGTVWVLATVVTCVICLLVGYAAGHHSRTRREAPPIARPNNSSPSAPVGGPALAQTGEACSVQHGGRLQLGVQVQNQDPSVLRIRTVVARAPLHGLRPRGLRPLRSRIGSCGELNGRPAADTNALPAGATTWLTVTVQVLVPCPAVYEVRFVVSYSHGAAAGTQTLPGFPDLGYVPYTGCAS
jgi:hypothetical protein